MGPTLIALFVIEQSQRLQRTQSFEHAATAAAHDVDQAIRHIIGELELLATSPALASGDYKTFAAMARAAAPKLPGGHLILLDDDLEQRIDTLIPGENFPLRPDSLEIARRARLQGRPTVSDLVTGSEHAMGPGATHWIFQIAVPSMRDGEVSAVLLTFPPTAEIAAVLKAKVPAGMSARIVDQQGLTVAQVAPLGLDFSAMRTSRNLGVAPWRLELAAANQAGLPLLDWGPWVWIVGGSGVLLLVSLAAWQLARQLSGSMETAAQAVEMVASGRPPTLPKSSVAETNSLIEALGNASARVSQRTRALKKARDEARLRAREAEEARDEARRRGREAEEARALLETLLDHVPEGITIVSGSPDFRVLAHSRLAREQLAGSDPALLEAPDSQTPPPKLYRADGVAPKPEELPLYRVCHLGEIVRDEMWILERPDGSKIPCSMNAVPIRDSDGKLIGAINCWRDISEREKEAAKLREATTLAHVVGTATQALISVKDPNGRFTSVNQACLQLFGESEGEVLGKTYLELFPGAPEGRQIAANDRRVIENGVALEVEERCVHGGRLRYYLSNKSPVFGPRGDVAALVDVSIDITDRKRGESVERLLAETDQDLAQLTDLRDMISRAVNRLGGFLGASRCNLVLVGEGGTTVTVEPGWRAATTSIDGTHSISPVLTPELRAALDGPEIVAVADVRTDPRTAARAQAYRAAEVAAFAVEPIIEGGQVRAYLAAHDRRPREWQVDELRAIHGMAARIWSARSRALTEAALRTSEERYRLAAQAIQGMIYDWDFVTGRVERSQGLEELVGYRPDEVPATIDWWHSRCHPDDLKEKQARIDADLAARRTRCAVQYRVRHRDGHWVHVADRCHILYADDGTPLRKVGSSVDVTGQVQAENRLRESEERFRALVEASAQTVWTTNAAGEVDEDSPSWRAFTGQTLLQFLGWGWLDALHPGDRTRIAAEWRSAVVAGRPSSMECRLRHRTGQWRWTQARAVPLLAPDGSVRSWVAMTTDITDRKKWEEQQRLLLSELSHRVKNVLAVVQAMATRTLSGGRSLAEASDVLIKRLHALSRAHDMLTTRDWQGAPLRAIIQGEFSPFVERARIEGPELMIGPRMAQTLALVLHELATNAAKYGALSNANGQVFVTWSVAGEGETARFKFEWREIGGPPVGPPKRRGFGTALLNMAISGVPDGTSPVRFEPQGLVYEIDVPLSSVT
jgi:PAS domain S-box-containing protein